MSTSQTPDPRIAERRPKVITDLLAVDDTGVVANYIRQLEQQLDALRARMLSLRPCTVKAALPFVRRVHRRLPKVQGAMWAVGVHASGEMIGVALVGWPAREMNVDTLAVLRVAVLEGHRNACSMLYGACSRAGKAMGAENMVTYTHGDESGTSLKAAGWIDGGLTDGGEWDRLDRPRQLALDPEPKRRWWAPWSKRAARETQ